MGWGGLLRFLLSRTCVLFLLTPDERRLAQLLRAELDRYAQRQQREREQEAEPPPQPAQLGERRGSAGSGSVRSARSSGRPAGAPLGLASSPSSPSSGGRRQRASTSRGRRRVREMRAEERSRRARAQRQGREGSEPRDELAVRSELRKLRRREEGESQQQLRRWAWRMLLHFAAPTGTAVSRSACEALSPHLPAPPEQRRQPRGSGRHPRAGGDGARRPVLPMVTAQWCVGVAAVAADTANTAAVAGLSSRQPALGREDGRRRRRWRPRLLRRSRSQPPRQGSTRISQRFRPCRGHHGRSTRCRRRPARCRTSSCWLTSPRHSGEVTHRSARFRRRKSSCCWPRCHRGGGESRRSQPSPHRATGGSMMRRPDHRLQQ